MCYRSMTNKKLKRASDMMKYQIALVTGTRNLMTVYLALHSTGVSSNKILALDDMLINEYIPRCKQDAAADVLLEQAKRFLQTVNISWRGIAEIVTEMSMPYLIPARYERRQLLAILESMSEDMAMYLKTLHLELGYGTKRLTRVLDAVKAYKGDALKEASETFGFDYGDMTALPTIEGKKNKNVLDGDTAKMIRELMGA